MNPHLGSTLDDFLRQDFALDLVEARAQKRVLVRQLEQLMRQQRVTKARGTHGTSRSALDRLPGLTSASVTLYMMTTAARTLWTRLDLRLSGPRRRRAVCEGAKAAPVSPAVRQRRR